jgi:hypothetical protein
MFRPMSLSMTPLWLVGLGVLLGAQGPTRLPATTQITVPADDYYKVGPGEVNPPCKAGKEQNGLNCPPLCVNVPSTATGLEARVDVSETDDNKWFGPCPVLAGANFLDCAGIPRSDRAGQTNFGWLRVFNGTYTRTPLGNGNDMVCYIMVENWASRARNVMLTVTYFK